MFQIYVADAIFCFWLWKNSETGKKTKRLEKEGIKKHLLDSIVINNAVEIEELNERVDKVEESEGASNIIKEYKEILRAKKRVSLWLRFIKEKFLNVLRKKKV